MKSQLAWKYGGAFTKAAEENTPQVVSPRLVEKLSTDPPSAALIVAYLRELAKVIALLFTYVISLS